MQCPCLSPHNQQLQRQGGSRLVAGIGRNAPVRCGNQVNQPVGLQFRFRRGRRFRGRQVDHRRVCAQHPRNGYGLGVGGGGSRPFRGKGGGKQLPCGRANVGDHLGFLRCRKGLLLGGHGPDIGSRLVFLGRAQALGVHGYGPDVARRLLLLGHGQALRRRAQRPHVGDSLGLLRVGKRLRPVKFHGPCRGPCQRVHFRCVQGRRPVVYEGRRGVFAICVQRHVFISPFPLFLAARLGHDGGCGKIVHRGGFNGHGACLGNGPCKARHQMPLHRVSRLVRALDGHQLVLLQMKDLRAFNAHGFLQHRLTLKLEGRQVFAQLVGIKARVVLLEGLAAQQVNIGVAGRVKVAGPPGCVAVLRQAFPGNHNVVVYVGVLDGVGGPQKLLFRGLVGPLDGLGGVHNVILAGVEPQMSRWVVADPARQHGVQFQHNVPVAAVVRIAAVCIRGYNVVHGRAVRQGGGLLVVIIRKDGRGPVHRNAVSPVQAEHALHRRKNVRPQRHLVNSFQIAKERAVQIRPFVLQRVAHGTRVRLQCFFRVFDVKHPLGQIEWLPVGQFQPLHQPHLLAEPYVVHVVVKSSVQVRKGHGGRPPLPVLQIHRQRSVLNECAAVAVARVIVQGKGHAAVRLQKFQLGQLGKVPFQGLQVLPPGFIRRVCMGGYHNGGNIAGSGDGRAVFVGGGGHVIVSRAALAGLGGIPGAFSCADGVVIRPVRAPIPLVGQAAMAAVNHAAVQRRGLRSGHVGRRCQRLFENRWVAHAVSLLSCALEGLPVRFGKLAGLNAASVAENFPLPHVLCRGCGDGKVLIAFRNGLDHHAGKPFVAFVRHHDNPVLARNGRLALQPVRRRIEYRVPGNLAVERVRLLRNDAYPVHAANFRPRQLNFHRLLGVFVACLHGNRRGDFHPHDLALPVFQEFRVRGGGKGQQLVYHGQAVGVLPVFRTARVSRKRSAAVIHGAGLPGGVGREVLLQGGAVVVAHLPAAHVQRETVFRLYPVYPIFVLTATQQRVIPKKWGHNVGGQSGAAKVVLHGRDQGIAVLRLVAYPIVPEGLLPNGQVGQMPQGIAPHFLPVYRNGVHRGSRRKAARRKPGIEGAQKLRVFVKHRRVKLRGKHRVRHALLEVPRNGPYIVAGLGPGNGNGADALLPGSHVPAVIRVLRLARRGVDGFPRIQRIAGVQRRARIGGHAQLVSCRPQNHGQTVTRVQLPGDGKQRVRSQHSGNAAGFRGQGQRRIAHGKGQQVYAACGNAAQRSAPGNGKGGRNGQRFAVLRVPCNAVAGCREHAAFPAALIGDDGVVACGLAHDVKPAGEGHLHAVRAAQGAGGNRPFKQRLVILRRENHPAGGGLHAVFRLNRAADHVGFPGKESVKVRFQLAGAVHVPGIQQRVPAAASLHDFPARPFHRVPLGLGIAGLKGISPLVHGIGKVRQRQRGGAAGDEIACAGLGNGFRVAPPLGDLQLVALFIAVGHARARQRGAGDGKGEVLLLSLVIHPVKGRGERHLARGIHGRGIGVVLHDVGLVGHHRAVSVHLPGNLQWLRNVHRARADPAENGWRNVRGLKERHARIPPFLLLSGPLIASARCSSPGMR
nr:MAG TPA: hypothetical protein [Caudoviricetes sp.]